jgi:hypothetical protein
MAEKPGKMGIVFSILFVAILIGIAGYMLFTSPKGPFARAPGMSGADDKSLPFQERIAKIVADLKWDDKTPEKKLTRKILLESLAAGTAFLLANQKEEGNFNYEYDFVKKSFTKGDNQVRQAGALWGVALTNQHSPGKKTEAALWRGLDFFFRNTREEEGRMYIMYPRERSCQTGTVALVALAIIESLRTEGMKPTAERSSQLATYLDGYLRFLRSQQLADGRFAMEYQFNKKSRNERPSPYFDGEALLALCKAARYLDRKEYLPVIQKAARRMAEYYTVESWEKNTDSDQTKGFYQWGSMAFREYAEAGWRDASVYEDTALALAWWMIHTHGTLSTTRNSGYAHEGLISAYSIAERRRNNAALGDIGYVIDRGLLRLTGWQVGGPLAKENAFLKGKPTDDKLAFGGVMNEKNKAPLRIDVAQHQMHAVLLALDNIYRE